MDGGRLTRVVIEVDTTSKAFEKDPEMELCRLLHSIQISISGSGLGSSDIPLLDWNGQTVGRVVVARSY